MRDQIKLDKAARDLLAHYAAQLVFDTDPQRLVLYCGWRLKDGEELIVRVSHSNS